MMNKFGKPSPALFHGAGHAEKVAGPSSTSSAPPAAPVDKPIDTTGLTPNNANGGNNTANNSTNAVDGGHGGHGGASGATLNAANGNGMGSTNPPGLESNHGSQEPTDLGNGGKVFEPGTQDHHNSGYGTKLSSGNVEAIANKMGIDYQSKIDEIKGDDKVFLGGKTDEQKEAGANLVLNSAMQFKTLQTEGIEDKALLENAATAKKLALAGDEQGLEDFINQNGNNEAKLNGKELVALFEPAEHQYNHPILNSEASGNDPALNDENDVKENRQNGHDYFHMTHLTSLNTDPGPYAHLGTGADERDLIPGTFGGYNDKGAYYQVGTPAATVATMERSLEKLGI
jgi:hypothetical protein